ncbi:MAG TPA: hypothetical protein VFJ65_08915 [Solirubrobacterales bacterium]|nr:hypothetical protein [Solirubrobacterales bacterium]
MEAHIAGIPVEETVLNLMPVCVVALGAVVAFVSRAANSLRAGRGSRMGTER